LGCDQEAKLFQRRSVAQRTPQNIFVDSSDTPDREHSGGDGDRHIPQPIRTAACHHGQCLVKL